MQLAGKMRRRGHLCLLSVADRKMTGCPDLPPLRATCCCRQLSEALVTKTVVHEKCCDYSSDSLHHRGRFNEKDIMKRGKGTEVMMQFVVKGLKSDLCLTSTSFTLCCV